MTMPPVFWGLLATPLWGAVFVLCGGFLAALGLPWALAIEGLAMVLATLLIARIDVTMRRPGVPALGWQLPPGSVFGAALLAGVGAAILGSEIDNIVRDRFPLVNPLPSHGAKEMEIGPPVLLGVTRGLVLPVCMAVLGLGIAMRNLFMGLPGWIALLIGALATTWSWHTHAAYWLPWLLAPLIGGWAYARSHSIWLAVAVMLPQHAVMWLVVFNALPGIPGFDTDPKAVVVFQPLWFDAIGVVCLAGGVFALIRALHAGPTIGPVEGRGGGDGGGGAPPGARDD